jgi:hypothetical protein
MFNFII